MPTDLNLYLLNFLGIGIFLTAGLAMIQRNMVRAGFTLIGALGAIALLFFVLGAELVALTQILVYAVGITLVVIFAIMLLSGSIEESSDKQADFGKEFLACTAAFAVFATFVAFFMSALNFGKLQILETFTALQRQSSGIGLDNIQGKFFLLGQGFIERHLIAFELVSVLLLVAFVAAIVISGRKT